MSVDFSKPVQTKAGRPVEILRTGLNTRYSVAGVIIATDGSHHLSTWMADGYYLSKNHPSGNDLVNVPPPRQERTLFINVHEDAAEDQAWATRREADVYAPSDRIACVQIDFDFAEGEGLEDD